MTSSLPAPAITAPLGEPVTGIWVNWNLSKSEEWFWLCQMPWAIGALQRGKDFNRSSESVWASLRKAASVWWFLTRAPHFLYPTPFCLGFPAVLKLWEEEQPRRDDSWQCWRPGNDSAVELAHRPAAALYHRTAMADSGSAGAGEAPSTLSLLTTPTKDAVTSSWQPLAHSLLKNVPNVHLLPSDLIFPEQKWPGLVTGLQARAQPLPLCNSTKAQPDTSDNCIYLVSYLYHTGYSS